MSKAEDLAAKLIIPKHVDDIEELCRFYYTKGYHQAEKDLELTVEDVESICEIEFSLCSSENRLPTREAFYQEILKQFKELKK